MCSVCHLQNRPSPQLCGVAVWPPHESPTWPPMLGHAPEEKTDCPAAAASHSFE
jgi:hypothetical protein